MALASAKQLLDELMGRDRNLTPSDKGRNCHWDLPDVCKHFLVKFCPNELFVNTKADLGPCSKVHDEKTRKEYEKSSRYKQMGYEEEFLRFCQGMLSDVEKRIRRAKQRLALGNQEGGTNTSTITKSSDEKSQVLTERINELLEQVEQLGCEGKVEEAQGIMKLCEQLKEERESMRKTSEPNHWLQKIYWQKECFSWSSVQQQTAEIAAAQEKQMEVCEVCGAFLIVGDAQQRVDDHLMGKQHVGYAKLKAAVEEILHKREKEKEEREKLREKEREDRLRQKEEEDRVREERRKQVEEERRKVAEKERQREKDRDRERRRSRSRDRKRSPSRSYSSRRSRSRERRHSSHKSRSRRSPSKDRSRERSHHHGHSKDSRRSRSHSRSRDSKRVKHSRTPSPGGKRKSRRGDSLEKRTASSSPSDRPSFGKYATSGDTPSENGDVSPRDGSDKESSRMDEVFSH